MRNSLSYFKYFLISNWVNENLSCDFELIDIIKFELLNHFGKL